tara:strand:+ start:2156 stop:2509 length:354 start_codon:yes stop_codon:yes gene_type:complete
MGFSQTSLTILSAINHLTMEVKMNNNNNDNMIIFEHEDYNGKRERFVKLAEYRTKRVLYFITLLSKLSNKRYYEYDKKQVEKISSVIKKAVTEMNQEYKSQKHKEFSLNMSEEVDHE